MGNYIINDEVKMNLTYTNFCLILFKEIWDFFILFSKKELNNFLFLQEQKIIWEEIQNIMN